MVGWKTVRFNGDIVIEVTRSQNGLVHRLKSNITYSLGKPVLLPTYLRVPKMLV